MRSLFLKIFLSFWAALALFIVLAIAVTLALRPLPDSPRWEYMRASTANRAAQAYERGGEPDLRRTLVEMNRSFRLHSFFFDDHGRELSGHPFVPAWAEALAKGENPKRGPIFGWWAPHRYVAQAAVGPSGRRYVMVTEFPLGPHLFFGPDSSPWLGITIALLSSGLVCFFLARYLTGPVVRLRAATKRLAEGDLTARAGIPGKRSSGDEIAQLVQDFDTMAGRIEDLVNAQSRLLNDISHELRSPLARLNVALGLARQRSGPEAAGSLDRMELEATRLNELIGRLLALARLEGNHDAVEKSPVRLGDLINDIAADASYEAQDRNCSLSCELLDDCVVNGNAALLRSAVENVVRNAMRYTHEGTEVEIRLECVDTPSGSQALIRVSDRGPGVPQESLDKLFRPFYRIDNARGRQTGGIGLGLSIAERALRLHGGSARAINRPGGGLVVELRLPAAKLEERKPVPPVPAEA